MVVLTQSKFHGSFELRLLYYVNYILQDTVHLCYTSMAAIQFPMFASCLKTVHLTANFNGRKVILAKRRNSLDLLLMTQQDVFTQAPDNTRTARELQNKEEVRLRTEAKVAKRLQQQAQDCMNLTPKETGKQSLPPLVSLHIA